MNEKEESNSNNKIIFILILLIISFYIGKSNGDPNDSMVYGDTGLPKNCRAIIDANVKGWYDGIYSPSEALGSIDRNCGANGYSWGR